MPNGVDPHPFRPQSTHALFDSFDEFAASTYGALWFSHDVGTDDEFYNNSIAACQNVAEADDFLDAGYCNYLDGVSYTVSYNFTSLHVAPTYQALADEALMREAQALGIAGYVTKDQRPSKLIRTILSLATAPRELLS